MMTREEFDVLVRAVENGIGRQPDQLRRRVVRLALVGYTGLLGGLLIVLLVASCFFVPAFMGHWSDVLVLYAAGLLTLGAGGVAVMKVLWIRLEPPKGRAVTRTEAPLLFAALEELQRALRSAPFHEVLLVPDCNAAVIQHPRLGMFGWPRNFLLLGLPLLEGLSADEMRAVLAHEFAHLSRQHGRMGQRVYCLRRSWEKVFEQFNRPRVKGEVSLRPLYAKFLDWFWPRFNAHAFVLSRANEYEADADAARLVGAQHLASSLLWIKLGARHFEDHFWPDLWLRANSEPQPPRDAFLNTHAALRAGFSPGEVRTWIEQAFNQKTTNADTHPCLTERLQAVQQYPPGLAQNNFPTAPAPVVVSASETWFGDLAPKLRAELGSLWAEEVAPQWQERHARANALKHRLERIDQAVRQPHAQQLPVEFEDLPEPLDSSPPPPPGDEDTLWDKARVLLDLRHETEAEPLLRRILTLNPKHCAANFQLGRLLLEESNPAGVTHLEAVMAEDDQAVPEASKVLHAHYWRTGQTTRIKELEARLDRYEKSLAASHAERSSVSAADAFIPHGLSELELQKLRATLSADAQLAFAELARKEMKHLPKQRMFVLCVHRWRAWHGLPNHEQDRALVNRLVRTVELPGRVLVIPPSGSSRALARKVRGVPGSEVYRHAKARSAV